MLWVIIAQMMSMDVAFRSESGGLLLSLVEAMFDFGWEGEDMRTGLGKVRQP